MSWTVVLVDSFRDWLDEQEGDVRDEIRGKLLLLARFGPNLRRPQVGKVAGSGIANLKELVIQVGGDPWRVLFAFDPDRSAVLLVGGCKRGDGRWYERAISLAERRYAEHITTLKRKK